MTHIILPSLASGWRTGPPALRLEAENWPLQTSRGDKVVRPSDLNQGNTPRLCGDEQKGFGLTDPTIER